MWRKLTIALGSVLVIFLLVFCFVPLKQVAYASTESYQDTETYYVSEPYTTTEAYTEQEPYIVMEPYTTTQSKSQTLWNNTSFGVSAGFYQTYYCYIDVANKTQNFVTGTVQAMAGGEFLFYVFDQKNYNAWKSAQSYQPYVAPGRVTYYSFSFVPDHTDYYYFVFSNTFSWVTNKLIQFSAIWNWKETSTSMKEVTAYRPVIKYRNVTRYRDVPKQRVVWKTRPVTLYKKVSILQYLMSH